MKKMFLVLALCLSLFAANDKLDNDKKVSEQCSEQKILISENVVNRSGCCSHHGGVDGCSGGRVVCNDGSLSPSCTCLGGMPIDSTIKN